MVDAEITLNLEKSQRHHSFSYKIAQTVPRELKMYDERNFDFLK